MYTDLSNLVKSPELMVTEQRLMRVMVMNFMVIYIGELNEKI